MDIFIWKHSFEGVRLNKKGNLKIFLHKVPQATGEIVRQTRFPCFDK